MTFPPLLQVLPQRLCFSFPNDRGKQEKKKKKKTIFPPKVILCHAMEFNQNNWKQTMMKTMKWAEEILTEEIIRQKEGRLTDYMR